MERLEPVRVQRRVRRLSACVPSEADIIANEPSAPPKGLAESKTEFLADVLGDGVLVDKDVVGLILHEGA